MRKAALLIIGGVIWLAAPDRAFADLAINLTAASLPADPGADAVFTGTLTNTGSPDIFLNDINFSFTPPAGTYLTADRNFFFANVPGILSPGETYSGPIFSLGSQSHPRQRARTWEPPPSRVARICLPRALWRPPILRFK
jgi:hypothetical protein